MISPIVKKPMISAAITLDWASCAREMFRIFVKMVPGEAREERAAEGALTAAMSGEKVVLKISTLLEDVSGGDRKVNDMG